ncbi:hypothetical protein AMS68_004051 [Peltaster fructicola]|uniref:BAR domain-containing protein n=1 Tax=Peltaster fructicola TaxID=286661 RepID=A0A6H0XUX6_9PEZI|nr:hypothetical protein AMS68_004051 [Peltaster fructicola]
MQRRLSLLKQWGKERFGSQRPTQTSDEFKAMEAEMQLRHNGLTRLQTSTRTYLRWLSKRYPKDKDRQLPVGQLGAAMAEHGNDFDEDVEFGQCLIAMGQVQDRLARIQEAYLANVKSCWMESLDHSLAHMAEYHDARRKLESKRLAYDAARSQLQSSRKDDPRLEAAVITQKRQYIETYRDVSRLMREISDAENDSIVDLTSFVGAQIAYHERSRAALLSLRDHWPASARSMSSNMDLRAQNADTESDTASEASSRE